MSCSLSPRGQALLVGGHNSQVSNEFLIEWFFKELLFVTAGRVSDTFTNMNEISVSLSIYDSLDVLLEASWPMLLQCSQCAYTASYNGILVWKNYLLDIALWLQTLK